MKIREIYEWLNEIAPFDTQCDFDNCGLLIGDMDAEVSTVGLALDVTNPIIIEAERQGVQLILTHHPVLFHAVKQVLAESPVYQLIRRGIATIASHTNLDKADSGVNAVLAEYYELKDVCSPLILEDLGRIGELKSPMTVKEYAQKIKENLGSGAVRYYDAGIPVERVAYISGGGGSQFEDVLSCGVDTFITGDLKHDQFIEAQNRGFNLIEANHFDSENTVLKPLGKQLQEQFPELKIVFLSKENPVKTV